VAKAKVSKSSSPRAEAAIRGGGGGSGDGQTASSSSFSSSTSSYQDDGTGVIIVAGLSLAICAICVLAGPVKVLQSVGSLIAQGLFRCIPFLVSKVAPSAATALRGLLSSSGFKRQPALNSRQKDIEDRDDNEEEDNDEDDEKTQLRSVRVGSSPSRSPIRGIDFSDKGKQQQVTKSMKLGGKKGLVNTNTTASSSLGLGASMHSSSSPNKDSTGKWEVAARGGSDLSSGVIRDDDDNTGVGSGAFTSGTRTSTIARRGTSPAPAAVVSQVKVQRPNNGWEVDDDNDELDGLLNNTTATTTTAASNSGTASKKKHQDDGWGNEEW